MCRIFLIPSVLLTALVALSIFYPVDSAEAKAGCCLQRDTNNGNWRLTNFSFTKCEKLNRADKDNVYQEHGKVWWNENC